jgi:hypothetical protein
MSNNPFLKSNKGPNKQSNNRFQFLDKELDVTQIKKEKKPISTYDSTDNSFTIRDEPRRDEPRRDEPRRDESRRDEPRRDEPRRDEPRRDEPRRDESRRDESRRDESRRDESRRDESRRDDRRNNNNFKDGPKKAPIKKAIFDLANEYFPDLVSTNEDSSNISQQSNSNFKDMLNMRNQPEILPFQEYIEPGWVKITRSKNNNEIIKNYGLPTEYEIQLKKQAELENDLHYCMTRGIEKMKRGWEKYKEEYDEFNGEGAYDEKYTLPSIDDQDYDIEDESDEDDDYYSNNE